MKEINMKKIIILLLACLMANTRCMEEPLQADAESEVNSFAALPDELIMHLFSFIPEATSMKEIFNKLAQLSLVDSTCKQIAEDSSLLKTLAKRFVKIHPEEAEEEFLESTKLLLKRKSYKRSIEIDFVGGTLKHFFRQWYYAENYKRATTITTALASGINDHRKDQALLDAIVAGNIELARSLLDAGADVNSKTKLGLSYLQTSLCLTPMPDRKDMVQLLLHYDADVNFATRSCWNALMSASYGNQKEIVKLLIDKRADVNAADIEGNTALMMVSQKDNNKEIAKLLIDSGANVNIANKRGNTALIYATIHGHQGVVEILLAAGADVNTRNRAGRTALIYASENGSIELVELLLAAGADRNVVDARGNTALMRANRLGYQDIGNLLRRYINPPPPSCCMLQ